MKIFIFVIAFLGVSCKPEDGKVDSTTNRTVLSELQVENDDLELLNVKSAALRAMMNLHAGSDVVHYYVIEESALLNEFENFKPKVVINENNRFGKIGGVLQEISTGKNATIWSIANCKMKGKTAEVDVLWGSASLAAGVYFVNLERKESGWTLISYEKGPSS